jgi:Predicted AAA-ATPase/PD-(D/E)XK nuclease superfamily
LWIDSADYDWTVYPVIRIDMSRTDRSSTQTLSASLSELLRDTAKKYDLVLNTEGVSASVALNRLIEALVERYQQKVVVLIDEYDKPMLDVIESIEKAKAMRDVLRDFYTILKSQDGNLKFLLLTGVTKFSKVSVFSGLNNLQDLTMTDKYATLLGYTQSELEIVFAPWIARLAERDQHSVEEEKAKIKHWYNGYRFSSYGESVYNPFSTLLLFEHQQYWPHWFVTGTPTFLIKLIARMSFDINQAIQDPVRGTSFESHDIDKLKPLGLLYQTGYLTIESYDSEKDFYQLNYPNHEVEQSFLYSLLDYFVPDSNSQQEIMLTRLGDALAAEEFERFFEILKNFLVNIPYELHIKSERYYQNVFYFIFTLIGVELNIEVHTNVGRIDAVIEFKDKIIIFEFKLDQTAEIALQQIHDKKYADKYRALKKPIHLLGVSFSTSERNVVDWKTEKISVS